LDRYRNATRSRRRGLGEPDPAVQPTGINPLDLIQREHYERTRPPRRSLDPNRNQPRHPGKTED
jgi:hypothetical protein